LQTLYRIILAEMEKEMFFINFAASKNKFKKIKNE